MAKKPAPPDSFTSLQILGGKAQELWSKARARVQQSRASRPTRDDDQALEPPPSRSVVVEVRPKTVAMATVTALAVFLGAWALFALHDTLLILVLSFFLSIVIDASVRFFESWRVPRSLAVILVYVIFLSLAIFLVVSLIPIVANEVQNFAGFLSNLADSLLDKQEVALPFLSEEMNSRFTVLLQAILRDLEIKDQAGALFRFGQDLSSMAQGWLGTAIGFAGSVFNFITSLMMILILAFFIQMEREHIIDYVRFLLPRGYRTYYDTKSEAVYHKMSQWFQGQIILCVSIGVLVFIALTILGMPYALTLALLAGFTEFIPVIGPIIAAVPAVFIALTQAGFVWALIIAMIYYIIQLCENNLLVPLIMKHAVGLSPIVIMVGMLVGISFPNILHPVLGILLAIPVTTIITIFLSDLRQMRKR